MTIKLIISRLVSPLVVYMSRRMLFFMVMKPVIFLRIRQYRTKYTFNHKVNDLIRFLIINTPYFEF